MRITIAIVAVLVATACAAPPSEGGDGGRVYYEECAECLYNETHSDCSWSVRCPMECTTYCTPFGVRPPTSLVSEPTCGAGSYCFCESGERMLCMRPE